MATGASTADLVIILLDAHRGMTVQSRRHGYIAALLGIPHLVDALNKMDIVGSDQETFRRIHDEYKGYLDSLGVQETRTSYRSARSRAITSSRRANAHAVFPRRADAGIISNRSTRQNCSVHGVLRFAWPSNAFHGPIRTFR